MQKLYDGLAEIFEVSPSDIDGGYELGSGDIPWDSLAVVMTIALVDNEFGCMLDGKALLESKSVADIEGLIAAARK